MGGCKLSQVSPSQFRRAMAYFVEPSYIPIISGGVGWYERKLPPIFFHFVRYQQLDIDKRHMLLAWSINDDIRRVPVHFHNWCYLMLTSLSEKWRLARWLIAGLRGWLRRGLVLRLARWLQRRLWRWLWRQLARWPTGWDDGCDEGLARMLTRWVWRRLVRWLTARPRGWLRWGLAQGLTRCL